MSDGSLRDLTPQQWKSGIAAWLGWLFDGLDMHLYTLAAAPFVMQLLQAASPADAAVTLERSLAIKPDQPAIRALADRARAQARAARARQ